MNFSILKTKMFLTMSTLVMAFAFAGGIFAQSGTSTVAGSITDQTGAAVPGATVTVISLNTGATRSTITDSQGNYSLPGLQPATYRMEVSSTGFKKAVNKTVQALVDSTNRVNIALEPGEVSIEIDVSTSNIESVVNTTDASIGNNFVPEQITQLPTELRRINDLLSLQPGVTRDGYVAGGRSDQANITLDGVDVNDQQTGGRSGGGDVSQGSALRLTAEAIEEFRITTVGANANQGRSSGAQISLVTKGGTNRLRGAAFWFRRPTEGSSNDFFNNLAGVERPSLDRDVYGGAIGGPIKQDKLFFFYSYERQKQVLGVPVNRTVPLAHLGNGQIRFQGTGPSCDANNNCTLGIAELNAIYSEVGINPAAVAALAAAASSYPSNNTSIGDGLNTGGFRFNAPTVDIENTHIARLDYNMTDSQQLFFRANYQWDNQAGTSMFPGTPSTAFWSHPYGGVIGHNWTISDDKINNFRYGYTRQAFSQQGDSADNFINFRFVYTPLLFARTLSRVTPVTNITDDFTWLKGSHTLQFGANIRIIRNQRNTFGNAYDVATTNPSFYNLSGAVINNAVTDAGYNIDGGSVASVQAAATALIGRYSQYSGNFTFDLSGSPLAAGTPSSRNFATEEYDGYVQDVWKLKQNLTVTAGLRYSFSRPVYEQNGFQVVPQNRLGDIFDRRVAAAEQGVALNELINFELAGPANNGQGFYSADWNNWQPSIAAAWSPSFEGGFLKALFGEEGDSTIRGGFRITNDQFGGQLAVSFDGLSTIGFTSSTGIAANTFDITGCGAPPDANGVPACAPLFTGFGQDIRSLPGIPAPTQRFNTPADEAQRIESSLDGTIVSPTHYVWNASFGRSLPSNMYFEANYIGRAARNLFATRDVLALNNLVDPQSGMDWYTAAGILADLRLADTPNANVAPIPYFENLFDTVGLFGAPGTTSTQGIYNLISRIDGFDILDWTFVQLLIDDEGRGGATNLFFHPQYAAFSSFGTTAYSDYHGASFTLRQRLGKSLNYDFNYTFSKSMDNASGLSTDTSYGGQFILNPLRPQDNYSVSDFDTKHVINANFSVGLPIGRGRAYGSDMNAVADAIIGGWDLRGIYRWNSGQPYSTPFDQAQWATNWNVQSNTTQLAAINFTSVRDTQNAFANPQLAFQSVRNARPGETGERNTLRLPGFQSFDLGLQKSITMPWSENHKLQLRLEAFNVTNSQYFLADNASRSSYGVPQDPETGVAPGDFGNIYSSIQGSTRRFQFGIRYEF